jgi:hypothetical protein
MPTFGRLVLVSLLETSRRLLELFFLLRKFSLESTFAQQATNLATTTGLTTKGKELIRTEIQKWGYYVQVLSAQPFFLGLLTHVAMTALAM